MKKIHLHLALAIFICQGLISQTVSTYTDGTPDDAIAIDSNGDIYASNFTGDTVFKYDSNGNATPFITGLDTPNGLAFDSQGNLYVCDWNADLLLRYDSNGNLDNSITIPGNPSGMIKAFDNDDMIYTRYTGNTINRITPAGVITELSSAPELNGPVGLAYNEFGDLFVGNYNNRMVYRVEANGDLTYIATVGNSSNLGFIAYAQGYLWGTVLGEHKIYAIDPNGTDVLFNFAGSTMGGNDGPIEDATFNRPNGILFDSSGDTMYVTDFGSKNLRIISDVILASNDVSPLIDLDLYPNPGSDRVRLQSVGQQVSIGSIEVIGMNGSKVFISEVNDASYEFSVAGWSEGIYLLKVFTSEGNLTRKLVVSHR